MVPATTSIASEILWNRLRRPGAWCWPSLILLFPGGTCHSPISRFLRVDVRSVKNIKLPGDGGGNLEVGERGGIARRTRRFLGGYEKPCWDQVIRKDDVSLSFPSHPPCPPCDVPL